MSILYGMIYLPALNANATSFAVYIELLESEDEINKISNVYTDALFKKYEQHLVTLKSKFPTAIEIQYFEKQSKTFQKQAFFQKCL